MAEPATDGHTVSQAQSSSLLAKPDNQFAYYPLSIQPQDEFDAEAAGYCSAAQLLAEQNAERSAADSGAACSRRTHQVKQPLYIFLVNFQRTLGVFNNRFPKPGRIADAAAGGGPLNPACTRA